MRYVNNYRNEVVKNRLFQVKNLHCTERDVKLDTIFYSPMDEQIEELQK